MTDLSEAQKRLLSIGVNEAIWFMDKLIQTGDLAYAEAAIKKLQYVQRQTATFIENPSAEPKP